MRCALVAVLTWTALGCGPNPGPPVKVAVLIPNVTGQLTTTEVDLLTLTSATAVQGTAATFVGGASIILDPTDPLQANIDVQTDEQRLVSLVKNAGLDVRANYIDRAGVLWPADFHSWNMLTSYYNFERAYSYWLDVYTALPAPASEARELQRTRVYYWPEVRLNTPQPLTDNTLFVSLVKAYVVVPQKVDQLLPFSMNIGIVGHEMAHKVFNFRALSDEGLHPAIVRWNGPAFNLLKSLDEGLADYHGFGVTCLEPAQCRPAFLAASISDARTASSRDLSRTNACMDASTRGSFLNSSPAEWTASPLLYQVGTLWAAALYRASEPLNKRGVMQKALLLALDDESPSRPGLRQLIDKNLNTPQNFTPEAVANVILAHIDDPELKRTTCSQLLTRLQLTCTQGTGGTGLCQEIPQCPFTSARDDTTCPRVP